MAINLSKNKTPQLVYSTKEKRRIRFLLFMTIFMIVVTTACMIAGFAVMPVSRFNFMFITFITTLGYLVAFCYYDCYLKEKDCR